MAMFDFGALLGGSTDASTGTNTGVMSQVGEFFENPNNLMALGEAGSGISQGQPIGQAVGNAAMNDIRRRAVQQAGAKTAENQQSLMEQLINAIAGDDPRKLVGPKEDTGTFDNLSIGSDGSFTLKAPATKKPSYPSAQAPLESYTSPFVENNTVGF